MASGLSPEHKTVTAEDGPIGQSSRGRSQLSPSRETHHQRAGSEQAPKWAIPPTAINGGSPKRTLDKPDPPTDSSSYPTAAEIMDLLHSQVAILSGGRDRQGRSIITFPAQAKNFEYDREGLRRVIQYLSYIPPADVREYGFSVIVDGRSSNWQSIKVILRTLQEALPGQINVVYTIQPGQFWQKQQSSRGHNKEKAKLEFPTEQLSSTDKLIRYVESSQLTSDLGGFLPYNHELWIKLRLDLEHFISSYNALMEHTAHVEQQLVGDPEPTSVEVAEECLSRLVQMQDQLRKAPQNTIREGNDLLRALDKGREEAGTTGVTPDKINAQAIIRKLLDKIGQRQMQLDDLWRERKGAMEQNLQLRVFEKSLMKVQFWLKSRAEEQLSSRCDVGTSVEAVRGLLEQQDKFEAKTKHHHSSLIQLRRMADKFSGEQLSMADSLQRQVAKLSARYRKLEELLGERRRVLEGSLQLHTTMKQWRGLCQQTSELLKQDMSTDPAHSDNEHTVQLWQVADAALSQAAALIDFMKRLSSKLPSEGSKGAGPGYSTGIDHVTRLMEEVENHRQRVGQLVEARKLQAEELKRLHSCEKDTQQVTQWLRDMLTQQLLPGYGEVGDGVTAVERLLMGHGKFSDNAHKTYKYGCDLVSAAQRTRKSCRLDPHPTSALLTALDTIWEQLSAAAEEVKGQLEMAREFHSLVEECMTSYQDWSRPLHQLPKNPSLVEEKLRDMTDNQELLHTKIADALAIGKALLDRLEQPLTSSIDHSHPNEHVQKSLAYIRSKVDELQRTSQELSTSVPLQVKLLKDFLQYCQFEAGIERVLLWLQEHGLKQMHTFSQVKEGQRSISQQLELLEQFQAEVHGHSKTVQRLNTEAADVDASIRGFKSDLGKKVASLKGVWDKFTARLEERRAIISLAAGFYDNVEQFRVLCKQLESSQSTERADQDREKVEGLYKEAVAQGEQLLASYRQSPGDQGQAVQRLNGLMEELSELKSRVDGLAAKNKIKANGVGGGSPLLENGTSKVSKKYTNMYGELEEEAYKHLEELETQCDHFLSSHTHLRDTPDSAKLLCTEYNNFLSSLNPMETKLGGVVDHLTSLCPKVPPLAPSIQQLCTSVRGRMRARRESVEQRSHVLHMYDRFCEIVKEVNSDLSTLDEFLSEPADEKVTMETLETYKQATTRLTENYSKAKALGEQFLEVTSEMLTVRAGPKLEVGGACTSVAFDLGDLEGRVPDVMERWAEREKVLSQQMDWQSFKATYDEITTWLRESANKFLESRIDVGTSLETAEDLLMELGEFEIRAKRTADEVDSLLTQSKSLLSAGVREGGEIGDLTWDLRCLHDDFKEHLDARNSSLKDAVSFFMTSEKLRQDMDSAVKSCDSHMTRDLPTHLKITSVSTRMVNLQHQGSKLLELLGLAPPTPDHTSKQKRKMRARRTESSSASELAIKQLLSNLQKEFNEYKKAVERRRVSVSPQPPAMVKSPSPGEVAIIRRKSDLKTPPPKYQEAAKREKRSPSLEAAKTEKKSPSHVAKSEMKIEVTKMEKVAKMEKKSPTEAAKTERKSPTEAAKSDKTPVETTKTEKKMEKKDTLMVPGMRARANTAEALKHKKKGSAVSKQVEAFNQNSSKEDAEAFKEFGTLYGRPRSNTADPSMSPSKGRSPELPRRTPSDESPRQPDPPQAEVVMRRTPSGGVPLRKKGGGVSRAERREKINAIRKIFEAAAAESTNVPEGKTKVERTHSADKTMPTQPAVQSKESLSVPMDTRQRLNTAPSVVKAVLKDHVPSKQKVITITMEPEKPTTPPLVAVETDKPVTPPLVKVENTQYPDTTDLPVAPAKDTQNFSNLHSRVIRATRSASPQASNHIITTPTNKPGVSSSDSSPVRKSSTSRRPPPLRVSGKVSSLREMFDSQAKAAAPRLRAGSYSGKSSLERPQKHHRRLSSGVEPQATLFEMSNEFGSSLTGREYSPDIAPKEETIDKPHLPVDKPHPPEEPVETEPTPSLEPHPQSIRRPPSPVWRDLDEASTSSGGSCETSEWEIDLPSSSDESEPGSWDEADGEEPDSGARIRKSVSAVIGELIQSELVYSRSVEVLATIYLPMFSEAHVPSFLQGRREAILPNITEIHKFQRRFSPALCHHGNNIEAICQAFTQHASELQVYTPFLLNMSRGLAILSDYGGSFFEDKQRAIGDDHPISHHYCRVKERLVEYDHHLRELSMAAQKEALYAVEQAKEALKVVQKLLRDIDNTVLLNALRGCPQSLALDHMIRRDLFQCYVTFGKKKVREYHVILTPDHVIFTRARKKEGKVHFEFTESLKVAEMHLLETYKSNDDTFALCEGKLSPDNLRVLTPVTSPSLMKTVWLQEIRPLLQKKHSRRVVVGEEDTPLPHFFDSTNMPRPLDHVIKAQEEREGWVGSLTRGRSFRSSVKRTGSLRRTGSKRKLTADRENKLNRSQSLSRKKEIVIEKVEPPKISRPDDTVSRHSQISASSGSGLVDVQLATLSAGGQFLPAQDDDLYLVVEPYSSTKEGFLSVEKGQLVEVLDNSKAMWMVLTVARQHGELEMEGFIPARCLRLATKDEIRAAMSAPAPQSHETSHDQFEAETGQVPPSDVGGAPEELTTPTETTPLEPPSPSDSTGQNLSASVTIVPRNHGLEDTKDADSARSSPVVTKHIKPPNLDLVKATPTDDTASLPLDTPLYHDQGPHLSPMIEKRRLWDYEGEDITSSIRSLPTTFSPVATRSPQRFLGYDPMQVPEITLSYPELGPPAPPTDKRRKAREELSKLRLATVAHARDDPEQVGSVEGFDPVDVYVAIADFDAVEESSISLIAGQCVEVQDNSRSDWWLVYSSDSGREGWVPACYLEQRTLADPTSPPPEPFIDETGELAALMGRSMSELNRRELYNASFLNLCEDEPSDLQLQGDYSLPQQYIAITEISSTHPVQLSLVQDQPVTVLDSHREDWWLVRTIPDVERGLPGVEGWVPKDKLKLDEDIREDSVAEESSLATITSAFEETVAPKPQQVTTRPARQSLPVTMSPSSTPLWVVLADYRATEGGMLTVGGGDLVEVLDISRNEWCLVRPQSRPLEEGWVPMAYLKPFNNKGYAHPGLLPPRFHQRSSSSDSDTPTEGTERSSVMFSPEGLIEASSSEARTEAKERRRFVLTELAKTESDYVEKLKYCLENYYPVSSDVVAQVPSQTARDTLFGNLADIYNLHKDHFLPELEATEIDPLKLGDLFVSSEQQLRMYVTYCRNKGALEAVYHDHIPYFEERRGQLRDRLKLADYLILPVQRITKYTLLLQDFHKYSVRAGLEGGNILSALEVSRGVSTLANNAIHLNMLDDRISHTELGELVMQELFGSQEGQKQLYKERRIFLFERALIITKRRRDNSDKESYVVKEQLMLRDISMTQDMDPGRLNIITYDMITGTKFTLRAPKTSIRDAWLQRTNELIRLAKQNGVQYTRGRSSSEPSEYIQRTPSFGRRGISKRESTKRRSLSRPQSGTGVRSSTASPEEEQEPPGTEYVVMECIVMEGGDDVTLEPGDVVRLVRVEGGGLLRVRTVDEPPVEGKILASYLRKRDSVRGLKMEAIPKFTMRPIDMDLLAGTTATISCAFNGYPNPSIVWRKDHEILTGDDDRRRITSCPTSSVLEIVRLEYSDEGAYSCYITNSMGSDSADMLLTLHGPPGQPPAPTASKITSSSVKLKWTPPDNDGNSMVHSYQVEMLQEGFEEWQQIIQQPRTNYMVKSLLPNTTYHFRVTAYNEYGASIPSEGTKVIMGVKGRWQSFKRGNVPQITLNTSIESTDGPFDELGLDDQLLSPHPQNIRRGSISNAYEVMSEELGRGQYGIVHRCVHKRNGTELAAKYVRLRSKRKASIRKEVEILLRIKGKSPSLLEFMDAYERGRNLIIVTELIPDGELIERIIADNNLTEAVAVGYLSQLLGAVEALHALNIAHLDIRPENLLLAGDTLKLIDFGSAKEITSDLTPVYTSSVEFVAPEILNQELPSLSSDMWSVGVLTYVLLSGLSPFFTDNIQATVERIKESRYSFYHNQFEQVSQEAKEFIAALLQKSPEYRTGAAKALDHPWIKTLQRQRARDGSTSPWPMARLDVSGLKAFNARRKWHTMSVAVDETTIFGPRSTICLSPAPPDFEEMAKNETPPHLWDGPSKLTARVGSKVSISYSFAGNPKPTVIWEHEDVEITSSRHHMIKTSGGVTCVSVTDVRRDDEGVYSCTALNGSGSVVQECHLTVLDIPGPPLEVGAVILGTYNSAMVSWLPPVDTGNATIDSYVIHKRQLQLDQWEEVTSVSDSTAHVVEDLVPGTTYLFRVCAVNEVGIGEWSKASGEVVIAMEQETPSDSAGGSEVRLKMSALELKYERGEEIWSGTYSSVIRCRECTTDRLFAAKVITTATTEQKERALAEYDMHHCLSHPRVVKVEDAFLSETQVILVMEFLSGGTLQDLLSTEGVLSEAAASRYSRQLVEGLEYLHEAKIIMVNLSPDNILLTGGHHDLKITDFGLSRYIESGNQLTSLEGRVEFMSPEVVALQPLTTAADIWSVGTITYLMVTGSSPFLGPSQDTTVTNIASCHLDTDNTHYSALSADARDFIQYRVIVRNPRRRLTAVQCQRHRWLQVRNSRQSSLDMDEGRRGSDDKPDPLRRHSVGFQAVNGSAVSKRLSMI